jgi:hypothetical protein
MTANESRWTVCRHPWLLGEWSICQYLRHKPIHALSERSNQPIAFARIELAQQRANEMNEPARAKEQA